MTSNDDPHEYVGPYERWTYDVGSAYTFEGRHQSAFKYFSGIGEWVSPVSPPNGKISGDDGVRSMNFGDATHMHFHPMVLEPGPAFMGNFDTVVKLFNEIINPPENQRDGGNGAGNLAARNTFRLNFPISKKAFTPCYHPCEHIGWCPDTELKGRLDAGGDAAKKRLVIVAVIDDGLPFAHRGLCDLDGRSRVEFHWMQSAVALAQASVPIGRELARPKIQELIDRHGRDEDAIYRDPEAAAYDIPDPDVAESDDFGDLGLNIFRRVTHGAHVLGTAAGIWPTEPDAANAPFIRVIGVQLPRQSLIDTSGFGKDVFVLGAMRYIMSRAETIASGYGVPNVPVIVNLSLGVTGGPHDGGHQLEAAIDEVVQELRQDPTCNHRLTTVAIPSGNSFDSEMLAHIKCGHWNSERIDLRWRIQPNDRTSNYLECWIGNGFSETTAFENLHNNGLISLRTSQGTTVEIGQDTDLNAPGVWIYLLKLGGKVIGQLSADDYRAIGRWRLMIALAPTETADGAPVVPAGLWTVCLDAENASCLKQVDIHCYIHRDEDPADTGNGGRQSRFESNAGVGPEVTGYGSINGWAADRRSTSEKGRFAVAGYVGRTHEPTSSAKEIAKAVFAADYSGSGPIGEPPKVDFSHRSELNHVITGARGDGTRTGSHAYLQGTSAASPAFVREIALAIAGGADPSNVLPKDGPPCLPGQVEETSDADDTDGPEPGRKPYRKTRLGTVLTGAHRGKDATHRHE